MPYLAFSMTTNSEKQSRLKTEVPWFRWGQYRYELGRFDKMLAHSENVGASPWTAGQKTGATEHS